MKAPKYQVPTGRLGVGGWRLGVDAALFSLTYRFQASEYAVKTEPRGCAVRLHQPSILRTSDFRAFSASSGRQPSSSRPSSRRPCVRQPCARARARRPCGHPCERSSSIRALRPCGHRRRRFARARGSTGGLLLRSTCCGLAGTACGLPRSASRAPRTARTLRSSSSRSDYRGRLGVTTTTHHVVAATLVCSPATQFDVVIHEVFGVVVSRCHAVGASLSENCRRNNRTLADEKTIRRAADHEAIPNAETRRAGDFRPIDAASATLARRCVTLDDASVSSDSFRNRTTGMIARNVRTRVG